MENDGELRQVVHVKKADSIAIEFDPQKSYSIADTDFTNCSLTGTLSPQMDLGRHNFLRSSILELTANETNFENCDFVDSSIVGSRFQQCVMLQTHFNTCTISDSEFFNCNPTLTNFSNSTFRNVKFVNCDLSRILIKRCTLIGCNFENCTTTNKLFETCIVFGCKFISTALQVQSIFSNFGLKAADFHDSQIRTARVWESHELLDISELTSTVAQRVDNPLDEFRAQFFIDGINEATYEALDKCLDEADWLAASRVAGAFVDALERFSDFLVLLYEQNLIYLLPLLKLNSLIATLAKYLEDSSTSVSTEIYRSVLGNQMIFARTTERFLLLHSSLCEAPAKQVIFLGNGPAEIDYFQQYLEPMLTRDDIELVAVRPKNSPVEVVLDVGSLLGYASVVAVFLSTRFKLDIQKIESVRVGEMETSSDSQVAVGQPSNQGELIAVSQPSKLMKVEMGRGKTKDQLFQLKFKAIAPGSLLVDMGLDFSLKRALSVHKSLFKIVFPFKRK